MSSATFTAPQPTTSSGGSGNDKPISRKRSSLAMLPPLPAEEEALKQDAAANGGTSPTATVSPTSASPHAHHSNKQRDMFHPNPHQAQTNAYLNYVQMLQRIPDTPMMDRHLFREGSTFSNPVPGHASTLTMNAPSVAFSSIPDQYGGASGGGRHRVAQDGRHRAQKLTIGVLEPLLGDIGCFVGDCVTANDYAIRLHEVIERQFDLDVPLSTEKSDPRSFHNASERLQRLLNAADGGAASLSDANKTITVLRDKISELEEELQKTRSFAANVRAIRDHAIEVREGLNDLRNTVKYSILDVTEIMTEGARELAQMSGSQVSSGLSRVKEAETAAAIKAMKQASPLRDTAGVLKASVTQLLVDAANTLYCGSDGGMAELVEAMQRSATTSATPNKKDAAKKQQQQQSKEGEETKKEYPPPISTSSGLPINELLREMSEDPYNRRTVHIPAGDGWKPITSLKKTPDGAVPFIPVCMKLSQRMHDMGCLIQWLADSRVALQTELESMDQQLAEAVAAASSKGGGGRPLLSPQQSMSQLKDSTSRAASPAQSFVKKTSPPQSPGLPAQGGGGKKKGGSPTARGKTPPVAPAEGKKKPGGKKGNGSVPSSPASGGAPKSKVGAPPASPLGGRRGDAGTPPSLLRQASSLMSSNDLGAARRPIRSKHVQTETVDGIPALDVVLAGSSQQHPVDTSPLLDSIFPSPAPSGTLDPTAGGSVSVPLQRLASTSSNPLPTEQQQQAGQPPKSPSPLQLSSYDDPPQPSTSHSAFSSIFNTTEQKLIHHLLTELEEMLMPHDEKDAEQPPTPTPPEALVLRRLSTWLFGGLAGTNSASSLTSKNEKDRPSDLRVSDISALRDSASSSTTSVKGAALMPDSTPLDGSSAFNRLRSIKSLSKIRRRLSEEGIPVVSEEGQDSESNSVADDGNETKPKHGDGDDVDGDDVSNLKPHFSMPSKAPEPEMEMPSYMQKAGSVADIPSAFAAGRTTSYRSGSISGGHGSMLKKKASTKQIPSSEGATSGAGELKAQTPEPTTGTHPHTGTGGAASPMEQLMAQRRRRNKNPSSSSHHSRVVLPTLTRDEHHAADGDQSAVDGAELDNLRAMLQLMPSMVSGGGGHHNSSGVEGSYQHHQRHAHPLAQDGDVLDPVDVGTSKQLMFSSECALPTPARSKSLKQL